MPLRALVLVLAAAVMHTGWNFIVKRVKDKQVSTWWALIVGSRMYLPLLVLHTPIPARIWPYALSSAFVETVYSSTLPPRLHARRLLPGLSCGAWCSPCTARGLGYTLPRRAPTTCWHLRTRFGAGRPAGGRQRALEVAAPGGSPAPRRGWTCSQHGAVYFNLLRH